MKTKAAPPALNVRWHDGRLVGRVIVNGPTYFAYDEGWLQDGHDLSPISVPFGPTAFRQRADGFDQLPGFLSDCLPDQWGRRVMHGDFEARSIKATPMRMLAWVGQRGLGALSFEPALEGDRGVATWDQVTSVLLAREAQAVIHRSPVETFAHLRKAGTAGGALPKATVALLADGTLLSGGDVAAAASQHPTARLGLLKLDVEEDPTARSTDGRMEHAYMLMAGAAGIRCARTQLLTDSTGSGVRHHLFVERFDFVRSPTRRRHLLTLAGARHTFRLTYRDLLSTVRQLTQDHQEVLEAARRMIFNVRTGNADDHGKNHSFLYVEEARQWTLSPAYDLTLNFSEGGDYHGLFPASFGTAPRIAALAETAADAGVSAREFAALDEAVVAALRGWPEFCASAGMEDRQRDQAAAVHQGLAATLDVAVPARRSTRRKLW